MSKKKSYMNNKNILSEGFFSKIKKILGLSSKEEKLLKRNKPFMNNLKDLNNTVSDLEDSLNDVFKQYGKKSVKLDKYKISDFTK
jgi:hypothetical protein